MEELIDKRRLGCIVIPQSLADFLLFWFWCLSCFVVIWPKKLLEILGLKKIWAGKVVLTSQLLIKCQKAGTNGIVGVKNKIPEIQPAEEVACCERKLPFRADIRAKQLTITKK